jgi:excisionase family DNA binding protein
MFPGGRTLITGWLDIKTAFTYCSTSKRTVEMWIKDEGLRYCRVRGKRLIKREWLDEFLESREETNLGEKIEGIVNELAKDL